MLRPPRVPDGDPLPADWVAFLRGLLNEACCRLAVTCVGEVAVGPIGRSIGARTHRGGHDAWLRVAPFYPDEMDRETWTGNSDAGELPVQVRRPRVIERTEWRNPDPPVDVGAELMTYVPDRPCAPYHDLSKPLKVTEVWWGDLRSSLDALAAHHANRDLSLLTRLYSRDVAGSFGPLPETIVPAYSVQHADLHWSNLTAPNLQILDWELWGVTIDGLGVASLYCSSLLVPEVAAKVREVFADVLDSPSGRYAQLAIIADRINYHDPSYDSPLGTHLRDLAHHLLRRT